jgi:predicted GNAT superfamily acetyltransferase
VTTIRPLHAIPEILEVIALEQEIWGSAAPEDAVGVPLFVASLKRGAILLGALEQERLIGFVYSFPGLKDGRPMHWSHMLGVLPAWRSSGIGRALKLEQRRRCLAMGIDLMEWTFDPLVAVNAHLNFRRLGVVVEEFVLNVYGESASALHRGAPTDRFIAQWRMASPRVEALIAGGVQESGERPWRDLPCVTDVALRDGWLTCAGANVACREPAVTVAVPARFTDMLAERPDDARAWRMITRDVFQSYLSRGYRATDVAYAKGADRGVYLLEAVAGRP